MLSFRQLRNLAVKNGYRIAYTRNGYIINKKPESINTKVEYIGPMTLEQANEFIDKHKIWE